MSPQNVILVLLCAAFSAAAQVPQKIRFAKDKQYIYFFQTGRKCDTITAGKTDAFYFLVPDSIKKFIVISSENAAFVPQANDSIVLCKYANGIKYESYYYKLDTERAPAMSKNAGVQADEKSYKLKFGPNGSASVTAGQILVQIIDTRNNTIIIENRFYCLR